MGDGSGTGWQDACGWAVVMVDRETRARQLFYGGMSDGTVNVAELMPYLQALGYFHNQGGKQRLKRDGLVRVFIITDSRVTATNGTTAVNPTKPLPRSHGPLWAAMREYANLGYAIKFRWAQRSDSLLNWTSDLVAGLSRRAMLRGTEQIVRGDTATEAAEAIEDVEFVDPESGEAINLQDLNPS